MKESSEKIGKDAGHESKRAVSRGSSSTVREKLDVSTACGGGRISVQVNSNRNFGRGSDCCCIWVATEANATER
jgi:hypothetical protein